MSNPIKSVPLRTPMFDGEGMKALGNLSRLWTDFFSSGEGWLSQGTHAERLATSPGGVPDGGFFVETNRSAIYQSRFVGTAQAWVLAAGVMAGLLAARPNDLGANDIGFLYSATDALDYRWNGTAWATLDTARGGGALTHVGRVTKVGAAGVLAESSLTDDGTKVSGTERVELDTGATPQNSQVKLRAAGLGMLSLLAYAADVIVIGFDSDFAAGGWVARNASVAFLEKNSAKLYVLGSTGNSIGGAATQTTLVTIDLAAGDTEFAGNVGTAGVFKVDGDQVVGPRLGAIAAPTISTTTATGTAVVPYAANEAAMINQHVVAINQLNVDVANLTTTVNLLRDALRIATGHGLTS